MCIQFPQIAADNSFTENNSFDISIKLSPFADNEYPQYNYIFTEK